MGQPLEGTSWRLTALGPVDSPQAPVALWRAATLQSDEGQTGDAAKSYLALARTYPAADEGWRAYQAAGGLIYNARSAP